MTQLTIMHEVTARHAACRIRFLELVEGFTPPTSPPVLPGEEWSHNLLVASARATLMRQARRDVGLPEQTQWEARMARTTQQYTASGYKRKKRA
jgi:hypothetical protein